MGHILFNQSQNRESGRGDGDVVLLPVVGGGEKYIGDISRSQSVFLSKGSVLKQSFPRIQG